MVSVIIPVFNVEKYLGRCLDSVINQTYRNIEIILVNDGSTDKSLDICRQYGTSDSRIKIFEETNQGLSVARNTGIENATGEYLVFVDSDDYIDKNMIKKLYESLVKYNADVAVCDFIDFSKDEEVKVKRNSGKIEEIYEEDFLKYLYRYYKTMVVSWNKLYKRKIFTNLRFPEGKLHEDEFILYKWMFQCKKIIYIREKLYFYYQRKEGIMACYSLQNVLDTLEALNKRLVFCKSRKKMFYFTQIRILHATAEAYFKLAEVKNEKILEFIYQEFQNIYNVKNLHRKFSIKEKIGFYLLHKNPRIYIHILNFYRKIRKNNGYT